MMATSATLKVSHATKEPRGLTAPYLPICMRAQGTFTHAGLSLLYRSRASQDICERRVWVLGGQLVVCRGFSEAGQMPLVGDWVARSAARTRPINSPTHH